MSARLERLREMRAWIDTEIEAEARLVGDMSPETERIIERACKLYDARVENVLSKSRRTRDARARMAAAWLLRRYGMSYPKIGAALHCDHTTAMYACRKIDNSPPVKALLLGLQAVA